MEIKVKHIFFDDNDEKFFGEGPYQLLKSVEETGSLHASAIAMGMAYSKATKLLKAAEKSLGFPLTVRKIGGKSGGGSSLTEEAKDFISRYEAYRKESIEFNKKLFQKYFEDNSSFGCVIMASGLGRRFGGDKLMAEILCKPMISYIVENTEGLFAHRVVVTRSEKVKAWCEEKNIPVVFHDLPGRNDTIRLGLNAIEEAGSVSGVIFCPGDMPLMSRKSISSMIKLAGKKKSGIFRMAYKGAVGTPVLFSKEYFAELKKLPQGKGGSEIIKKHKEAVYEVEVSSEYELWDVDTKEAYEKVKKKFCK